MKVVIALLENQIQLSETRIKNNHYHKVMIPTIEDKIKQCKDAIEILSKTKLK